MQADDKGPIYPDLAGKVAVVTGGSGGIGAATCRLLAANGAKVAVNGRDPARIDTVVDAIRDEGGGAIGVAGDCTDPAAVERMHQVVEQELGPTEVLAASIRHPEHVVTAARLGCEVATVPAKVFRQMLDHPLTTAGAAKFKAEKKIDVAEFETAAGLLRFRNLGQEPGGQGIYNWEMTLTFTPAAALGAGTVSTSSPAPPGTGGAGT